MTAEFERALEALDFEAARAEVSEAPDDDRAALAARLAEAESEAAGRAEALAGRIQSLARADHYEGLLALADDPQTDALLDVLAPEIRRGAELHLDGARRRQERFQASAEGHMNDASEALLLLDTTKARASLDRIDRRWLDAEQKERLDELVFQADAAAAERRDIEARTAEVLKQHDPPEPVAAPRTRSTSRGCAGSVLVILLVICVGLVI